MSRDTYRFGEFRFVPSARELWRGERRVDLPRRTFECLEHLILNRDRAIGRDELVVAIFARLNVSDAQLGQVVLRTRRAVDDDGHVQQAIRTIAGFGYRWVADVRVETDDAEPRSAPFTRAESTSSAAGVAMTAHAVEPAPAPIRRRAAAIAVLTVFALALAATFAVAWHRQIASIADAGTTLPPDSIVVLPIEVDGLREDGWVRLGAMDLVADRLREAGMIVPPSESVLTLVRAQADAAEGGTVNRLDASRVRATTAARLVVEGKATHAASGWTVNLRAQPAQGIAVPVEFAAHDAVEAARGATDLLLAALGHTLPPEAERATAFDETLQRARAAMLANELDTAREILTASPELARAPAELDYQLAQVDFRAGLLDRAESSLTRVLNMPSAGDAHFRAEVLTSRGSTRVRRGAFADGGRDFEAALALLTPSGAPLDRGRALVGRGNTRVAEHRFDAALADFGGARVALERAGDALGVARVDANLGMLELYRGRPAEAFGYLGGAADRFQSFGALHELLVTLTGIIDAELSMLQRDDAWKTIERGWALRERVTDPDQRVDLMLDRAEVLIGFGRYREADVLLEAADRAMPSQNGVLTARTRSLIADLAARRGQWRKAADVSARALAEWPAAGADADRAPLILIRQRALIALGDTDVARGLVDRSRDVPAAPSDTPGSVADALAMAEWEARQGDAGRADRWFRQALANADRRGVPAEIVTVAKAYAPVLLANGQAEQAATVIGRVASWGSHDFDCALLQLELFHALAAREPWFNALRQAQSLAGEREIPPPLLTLPDVGHEQALRLTGT